MAGQFNGSFTRMMVLSPLIGAAAGALGIYLSWFIDVSSGASVVLVATGFFVVSLAYASARDRLLRRAARSVSFTR
ncbi:MAG: metal ABC transporter permease [Chloroflexi bacterium]|nr:metal ABC transporter permease [Chloroflexota bacterium]